MHTNHLINEKSPYLQQHAHNPVDWYPWGPDVLNRSRAENRPIFLSIGYSTCHWCHVMEKESFENAEVAEVMNRLFINVKVDREERPDLDHVYIMTTVQMMTGAGGWPMSVWLTPDLKPFFAGTYFPPEERFGRPSFKRVLEEIGRIWKEENEKVRSSAEEIGKALGETLADKTPPQAERLDVSAIQSHGLQFLEQSFDSVEGGFGRAPKFPMPGYLLFLLSYFGKTHNEKALAMARLTWDKMTQGGLYDQLAGGFARYSTDPTWTVPHFEKMLYDNTQLAMVGVQLYQHTQNPAVRTTVEETLRYMLRDLGHSEGAFYSAEDADSEGEEGKFYVWTLADLKAALPEELSRLASRYFGVTVNGNFFDPHTGASGQNVLVRSGLPDEETKEKLPEIRRLLLGVRNRRPRPHRDEKILTEWNGLAVSAFARAGRAFLNSQWTTAAERTAKFLQAHLWDAPTQTLYRRWRDGDRKIEAFQTDYAFLIQGLIDLFEVTGHSSWLEWATQLHERMNTLFSDPQAGGYFHSVERPDVLVRYKEEQDNVIPSGNSIAALNGLRLGRLLHRQDFIEIAEKTISAFARVLRLHPPALFLMVIAAAVQATAPAEIVVVGEGPAAEALRGVAAQVADPGTAVIFLQSGSDQERLARLTPALGLLKTIQGRAAAYICANFVCQAPTLEPEELARLIFPEVKVHG